MNQSLSLYSYAGYATGPRTGRAFRWRQQPQPSRQPAKQIVRADDVQEDDRLWDSLNPWSLLMDELLADSTEQCATSDLGECVPSIWSVFFAAHQDSQ